MEEKELQEGWKKLDEIVQELDNNPNPTKKELIDLKKELESLKKKYKETGVEEGIIIVYARVLYDLTAKQDLEEAEQIVEELRELKKVYQGKKSEETIVIAYALALSNLAIKQDLEEAKQSVEEIKKLKKAYQWKEPEKGIVIAYALALFNLAIKQDLEEAKQSVEEIKNLKKTYQGKEPEKKIAIAYALALAHLIMRQDLEGAEESIEKIKRLMKEYEEREAVEKEIVFCYAAALAYLIKKSLKESALDYQELVKVLRRGNWKILKSFLEKVNIEADKKEEDKNILVHALIIYFNYHKIMEQLIFKKNEAKLSHYTSMKVLPKLIKPKEENKDSSDNTKTLENLVRLRCYNVAYMNDPEEGKCLYDYLRQIPGQEQQKKWLAENIFSPETENKYGVYFSSLTKAEDNLPMWQAYSAGGTGCSLVFKDDFFAEEIEEASFSMRDLLPQEIKGEVVVPRALLGEKNAEKTSNNAVASSDDEKKGMEEPYKIYAYEVSYVGKTKKEEKQEKETKEEFTLELETEVKPYINLIRDSLWKIAAYFTEDKNSEPVCPDYLRTFLISCLDEIRYLFKSSDYSYEQEVRLLKQVPYSDSSVQLDCERKGLPRTYIEYPKDLEVDEVILGPKAPKREEVAPYIEYCNQKNGTSIKIRSSEIKYR